MKFLVPAICMNVLVPGTGLLALGRGRLGLILAVCFGLTAEIASCGMFYAPASLPDALKWPAVVLSGTLWLAGQLLLVAHVRNLRRTEPSRSDQPSVARSVEMS